MKDQKHPVFTRFAEAQISSLTYKNNSYYLIDLKKEKNVNVLMTNGLSSFEMKTPPKKKDKCFVELCFCIPSYWDLETLEEQPYNWTLLWLAKISAYIKEQDKWIGDGHTFFCGKERESFSNTMKQDHLFVSEPFMLEKEFSDLNVNNRSISFLFLIPIFCDEMDYKQGKGTLLLKKKLYKNGVTEKLDDFRQSTLRNRWRFFK